ncbi:MAG: HAD-IA family hydrolase [Solirubrobacteraceae bacterium]
MRTAAAIFDLDDTLLDTSVLRDARDRRDWRSVFGRLTAVRQFKSAHFGPTEVIELVQQARTRGLKVGLLTHGPEKYARELLRIYGLRVDLLVSGSDGYPAKPDPGGLCAVAAGLGVETKESVYVGDSVGDFAAAAAAGMTSIGVAWSASPRAAWRHGWPDIAIDRPATLLDYLDGQTGLDPLGEAIANSEQPSIHWGSAARLGAGVYALGRYFSTHDPRSANHQLSRLVLKAKDDPTRDTEVAAIFEALATRVPIGRRPNLIVSVPPAPTEARDRFAAARAVLARRYDARDGGEVLRMSHSVDDYKKVSRDARAALNVNRFIATPLSGENALLIDDVLTSGGQSGACREALHSAGCGSVTIVTLSVTQDKLPDSCPSCGSNLVTRPRRLDGRPFIGCSNYPSCRYTRAAPRWRELQSTSAKSEDRW